MTTKVTILCEGLKAIQVEVVSPPATKDDNPMIQETLYIGPGEFRTNIILHSSRFLVIGEKE